MKRFSTLAVAALSLGAVLAAYAQTAKPKRPATSDENKTRASAPVKPNDVSAFMQLKLGYSQKVLEGIVLEDYDMIAKNAQKLGLLTQDENWQVLQTPEYHRYSEDFEHIAGRLKDAAQDRNLEGAALDYVQLTLNCVNCHKHVRGERRGKE